VILLIFSKLQNVKEVLEIEMKDSEQKAKQFLDWLLFPAMDTNEFLSHFFEKRVLYIQRGMHIPNYYAGIFSSNVDIPQLLDSGKLEYTYDVDITLYKNNMRYTLNPSSSKVDRQLVMDFFNLQKCSVRFLRPHQHVDTICSMLAQFEELFQMGTGCNAYWTPANSQGFSPHYDDVDVFILQLEGTKIWSLYQARDSTEILPGTPSPNFKQEEVQDYLVTTVELYPGDLLYCPRGTIHQAHTNTKTNAKDSLHITISTAQQMNWRKYLEFAIPQAIESAVSSDSEIASYFNRSLPVGYGHYMGLIHENEYEIDSNKQKKRDEFKKHLINLMNMITEHLPIDDAADRMFIKFLHDRLPPQMSLNSGQRTRNQLTENLPSKPVDEQYSTIASRITHNSKIQFITKSVARLVVNDEDKCSLFHSLSNTRIYHEVEEPDCLEFEIEYAPAIHYLLESYPKFISVSELPELEPEEQILLSQTLVQHKLALCMTNKAQKQTQASFSKMQSRFNHVRKKRRNHH